MDYYPHVRTRLEKIGLGCLANCVCASVVLCKFCGDVGFAKHIPGAPTPKTRRGGGRFRYSERNP